VVVAVGAVLLWWTWLRWINPLIDFGRELYIPWQLTEGKVLYEDLAYFNGPLSPYLNNLVFALLGVSLRSILLMNFTILMAVVATLYYLVERHADHFTATVGCAFFLAVFAFADLTGTGNYNYMAPYSHEATHGLALLLGSLLLLQLYLDRLSPRILVAIGLLLGLVFLTKPEFFVAIGPLTAVGVGLSAWTQQRSLKGVTKQLSALGAAAAVPFGWLVRWQPRPRGSSVPGLMQ
jgi:4-amino-4-deoxy-L-arabinose transferase-like glycosyltransferase